jgi:hypothetical protein
VMMCAVQWKTRKAAPRTARLGKAGFDIRPLLQTTAEFQKVMGQHWPFLQTTCG